MDRELTIGVIGGGASGAMTAIALLRHPSPRPRRVVVLEPSPHLGAGVAYSTQSLSHILNVRAKAMSARADEPMDFVQWARARGIDATGPEFLPRPMYGLYLRQSVATAAAEAPAGVALEHRRARAKAVQPVGDGTIRVLLADESELLADQIVLATGNLFKPPSWLPEHSNVVPDPWRPGAIASLRDNGTVFIAGTGLTAVDVVLALRDAGFTGIAHMVSTHGLIPAPHADMELAIRAPAVQPDSDGATTARRITHQMRADATTADDWRQTIDGIRPVAVQIWAGLPVAERSRILRHGIAQWAVLRHRMAPQVVAALDELRANGRLSSGKGKVVGAEVEDGRVKVTVRHGGVTAQQSADALVWCAGPLSDPRADPLLSDLIQTGSAARHPLGIGLDVEPDGRVRAASGEPWANLRAIGPLRKGAEWETLAVPEIRGQARDIASAILS